MEEITQQIASGKKNKGFALASLILGIIALVLIILALEKFDFPPIFLLPFFELIIFAIPLFAIICGIIALTKKENKSLSLAGIVLGVLILSFVLILTFFSGPTTSRSAAIKANLAILRAGIAVCCSVPTNQLQATAGSDICDPAVGTILPTHNDLGLARFSSAADLSYNVTAQCDTETPVITATIKNHRKEACDGVWTITESQLIIPPGC